MKTVTASLLYLALAVGASPETHAAGQRCLDDLERAIETNHPLVDSITEEQFERKLGDPQSTLILDVRDKAEFEVSRLPGALHVAPEIGVAAFMARFGDDIAGKTIVLYCSVGARSSALANRIRTAAEQRGAVAVVNLRGGIFAQHNLGRRLVSGPAQSSDHVHPYSRKWGYYLDFPNLARYSRPRQ